MKQTITLVMGLLCSLLATAQSYVIENGVLTSWIDPPEELTIPAEATSIAPNVFQGNTTIRIVTTNEVTEVGEYAFDACTNLEEVDMPKVTIIGQRAFRGCNKVAVLDMPVIEHIKDVAFHACNQMTEITFPASLVEFGMGALSNCAKLTSIIVSDENTNFEAEDGVLFSKGKTKLWAYGKGLTQTNYDVPSTVTTIGGLALFNITALKTISLPEVTTLEERVFYNCNQLTSVDLPKATSIGSQAFESCTKLAAVSMPLVTKLYNSAFNNCPALTSTMTLPVGLTTYGASAFSGTGITDFAIDATNAAFAVVNGVLFNKAKTRLVAYPPANTATEYTVPDGVETIASNAFYGCKNLLTINATPTSLKTLGSSAFYGCPKLETINFASSLTTIGEYAFAECPKLVNINFIGAEPNYAVIDGVIYNANETKLILYPKSKTDPSFTVPESVVEIANSAFYGCTNLTEVTLPNVVTVGSSAFNNCSNLAAAHLPQATTINGSAFYNCTKLTVVEIPKVTKLQTYVFYNCKKLVSVEMPAIKSIGAYAFTLCSGLTSVDASLARSLTYIGTKAFVPENDLLTVTVASSAIKSFFPSTLSRKYAVNVKTYAVSVAASGANGSVTATVNGQPFVSGDLEIDQPVVLSAVPEHNYTIDKWMVNTITEVGNTETDWTYTINGDASIEVSFTEKPDDEQTYALTFEVVNPSAGTMACSVDNAAITSGNMVLFGKEAIFTATPKTGYRVKTWLVDGETVPGNATDSYMLRIPKSASEVKVEFEVATFALDYLVVAAEDEEGHGTLIAQVDDQLVLPGNEVAYGKSIVFTATPDIGYKVKQWTIDGIAQNEYGKTITIDSYTQSTVVTVEFEQKTYQATFAVDGEHGTLSATQNATTINSGDWIAHGSTVIFTAAPDAGYRIKSWSVNDVEQQESDPTFTIDLITENTSVAVLFEAIPTYSITFNVVDNEGGLMYAYINEAPISSNSTAQEGTEVEFTINPDQGYEIGQWSVNGENISAFDTYSLTLTHDVTVTVVCSRKHFTLTYIAGENGTITGETTQTVTYGESGSAVEAIAAPGYRFVQWCDGILDNPRTDNSVQNNLILTVEFEIATDLTRYDKTNIDVYPNPIINILNIQNAATVVNYQLVNTEGQVELQGVNDGAEQISAPVQHLKPGVYVLILQTKDDQQKQIKLVKQ